MAPNTAVGLLLGISRAYLGIPARKKAMFYLVWVAFLSLVSALVNFDTAHSYFTQKHNVLNQFGVKIGWFWTWFVVGPYIWYCGRACYSDLDRMFKDMFRLLVATGLWWFTIQVFHRILSATSRCDTGDVFITRSACSEKGGKWLPGFDLSGHCFLMVYSILIMTEESSSFGAFLQRLKERPEVVQEEVRPKVQLFLVTMAGLHLFWDVQLVISTLYYHIMFDKVAGVAAAVGCWALSYRIAFKAGWLPLPLTPAKQTARN